MTTKITALKNHIIFKFVDEINENTKHNLFREQTVGGLYVPPSHESSAKSARWGTVVSVGPQCRDIKDGMKILIEPLAWTNAIPLGENEKVWKTDESKVLMYEE